MAYTHFIPKVEWLKGTLTGTTAIGSPIITGIADTSGVVTGAAYNMYFEGAGIPAGAVVLSKTATTVTIDQNATAIATDTFSFGHRITFEYPPKKEPIGEQFKWVGSTSIAKSGLTQNITDFIEQETTLQFSLVSQAIKDKFQFFLLTHAFSGESFSFFRDKGEPTSEEIVERNDNFKATDFKVVTRKGPGFDFSWSFKFSFRKVYA